MEFEVLNDILYETCSRLFQNRPVYQFRKQLSGNQEVNSKQSSLNTSVQSGHSQQTQQPNNNFVNVEPTLENWIQVIGPQKLQSSLRKLGIDINKLSKRDLEIQSLDQLQNEKKRVKNELKAYDAAFQSIFNRFPQRTEKEPMRPLYIYYKKLKQQKKQINKIFLLRYIEKAPPQVQPATSFQKQLNTTQTTVTTFLSQAEIMKKIDELKRQRSELRDKLNNFQNEFTQMHNRKIRFHRDIAPVEMEYKMYKEIKGEIQKYEQMLKR